METNCACRLRGMRSNLGWKIKKKINPGIYRGFGNTEPVFEAIGMARGENA